MELQDFFFWGGAGTQADSLLAIVIKVDLTVLLRKGKIGPKIN